MLGRQLGQAGPGLRQAGMLLADIVGQVIGGPALGGRAHALDQEARDRPVAAVGAAPGLAGQTGHDQGHGIQLGHAQVLEGGDGEPAPEALGGDIEETCGAAEGQVDPVAPDTIKYDPSAGARSARPAAT